MRKIFSNSFLYLLLFLFTEVTLYAQTPPVLGTVADFVIFTSNGAVTHTGIGYNSHITGNVGVNIGGPFSGFGNVDGVMSDGGLAATVADLNNVYNDLSTQTPALPHALLFGSETLSPGIFSTTIGAPAVIGGVLTLDGGGNPNSMFIFQIGFDLSTTAFAEVRLINGATACNVFWVVEGSVGLATGTKMRGTVLANNGAISIATNVLLEGRVVSTNGAIAVNTGLTAFTPNGCGSPVLTGPVIPSLGATECFALLTANGAMLESGISSIVGDVGSNGGGTVTGYTAAMITGTLRPTPDDFTSSASTDLATLQGYLASLTPDIELLYPADFGHSLVLTPHVYLLGSATNLTDTLFLNAEGNSDAVFVIKINGAVTTSTYSNVVLQNGAKSTNVFWLVNNASVDISNYSTFRGTLVVNVGAISLFLGDTLDGRALTTNGAITTNNVGEIIIPSVIPTITPNGPLTFCQGDSVILTASTGSVYLWSNGQSSQSITVYDSGNFTVDVTSVCGNSTSSTNTSVIKNNPSVVNISYALLNGDSLFVSGSYTKIPGIYYDTLVAFNGCDSIIITTLTDSMPSTIITELEFFNGFSPNGDGQNDYWNIPVLNLNPSNNVTIINRWGSEVWKGENYNNTNVLWTGKNMQGTDLPDGTYFYIIKYTNQDRRGWVHLKR